MREVRGIKGTRLAAVLAAAALAAVPAAGCGAADVELDLQLRRLPEHLRAPVAAGVESRLRPLGIRAVGVR